MCTFLVPLESPLRLMLEMNAVFNVDYPTRQASSYQDRKLMERVTSSVLTGSTVIVTCVHF